MTMQEDIINPEDFKSFAIRNTQQMINEGSIYHAHTITEIEYYVWGLVAVWREISGEDAVIGSKIADDIILEIRKRNSLIED